MIKLIAIALLTFVVGLGLGSLFGGGIMGVAGGVAGTIAGAQVGICNTVKTAQANGLLTEEQAGKLLTDAVAAVQSEAPPADTSWVASLADCDKTE